MLQQHLSTGENRLLKRVKLTEKSFFTFFEDFSRVIALEFYLKLNLERFARS